MPMRGTLSRGRLLALALVLPLAMPLPTQPVFAQPAGGGGRGQNAGPVEVGVVTLKSQSVPFTLELPGRVSASLTAQVRPQVGGIIEAVNFQPGAVVAKGDVLYQVSADTYKAQLASAQASLQRANAAVPTAQATVTRYEALVNTNGGVSQSELDTARGALLQAQADVASAQASVQQAQINLNLASIAAPIAGVIGVSAVDPGALVTANQADALATIRQLDPVIVELVDTSLNLLRIRDRLATGTLSGDRANPPTVTITLEDGTKLDETGNVEQGEPVVSETTGTFTLRATMPNPRRILLPGMFVRATVSVGDETAFLVPQRAVTRDAAGNATAYFVSSDGKAVSKALTTSRSYDNNWVVTGGVEDGDRVIIDGLQKISGGAPVTPVEVTLDADGVAKQTIPVPAAEPVK